MNIAKWRQISRREVLTNRTAVKVNLIETWQDALTLLLQVAFPNSTIVFRMPDVRLVSYGTVNKQSDFAESYRMQGR